MHATLRPTLDILVQHARYITGATGAAIALREGDRLVCQASTGFTAPALESRLQTTSSISAECLRTGAIQHCASVDTDERVDVEGCRQLGIESILVAPLRRGKEIMGLLQVLSMQPRAFGDADLATLKRVGRMAELVLEGTAPWQKFAPKPDVQALYSTPRPRRLVRYTMGVPIVIGSLQSGIPETIPGRSTDLSTNGLGALLAGELRPGDSVTIEFSLPFVPQRLSLRATVRHQDGLRHGFEFVGQRGDAEHKSQKEATPGKEVKSPLFMLPKILAGEQ